MRPERVDGRLCANEGCGRPAAADEPYCETCAIERALYRRDIRAQARRQPSEAPARRSLGRMLE